jgi:hypothetical protein
MTAIRIAACAAIGIAECFCDLHCMVCSDSHRWESYARRLRTDMLRWYCLRLASQGKAAIKIAGCAAMSIAEKPAS